MFVSFLTDVYVIFCYWNISMKCTHFMLIWHLLMLTYFLCRKYSRISILCKMLLSFSTDVYVIFCYWNISMKWMEFHLDLSLTDVDIFFVWKIFYDFNTALDYLLMLTIFHVQNVVIILDWCLCHFLLLKHIDEVHALHVDLSFTYVDIFFCVENILEFQYCFWLFTDVDYFSCGKCCYHSRLMFMWFSVAEIYRWSGWTSIFICHLLMLTYFLCRKYSTISILVLIIYWCWLFFVCKMFLSFSTDVFVIFCYWNISMKWMDFHLHLSLTDVDIFFVWKIFYDLNTGFDYLLMLTIFRVQNVLIILDWCLCDFLLLKHIDEVHALHVDLSFTDVDIFLCGKYSTISILLLIIYWCWLFFMCKMFLSFLTDVYVIFCYWNISMKCTHFMLIWHLLMLTYFLCGKYSRISILCKMLLSFSTDVYVIFCYRNISMKWMEFHLHLSLTDVDIFFVWKIFYDLNTGFDYLLMLTIFRVQNVLIILDWCLCDFLLLKHIDEVHALHVDLSFTYVDIFFCVENILEFQYCFWLFTDVDYFSCGKCCYHCQLMFMWFSVAEIYRWSGWTSIFICHLLMLTYFLCRKYSTISILVLIIYWCWLFFVCKMFLSFSTDVFVIFCYWNISMKWMDFHLHLSLTDVDIFFVWKIFYDLNTGFDYLLMLTIFRVQNVLIILDWCLCDFLLLKHIDEVHALHVDLSFTYVDIFLCGKYSTILILLLIIYWCWLFFMCKMFLSFLTDVYVIFCYWNISMKCTHFMLIWHLLMLTYFLCGKYSRISVLCKMLLSFSTDVYVIFCYRNISMKWMEFHLHLSLTDVDIFFV